MTNTIKHPALALATLGAALALASAPARAAEPGGRPHELGWVCVTTSDLAVAQVSGFNRDAPVMSLQVPKQRLYTAPADGGLPGGRVCAPTVVRLGDGDVPDGTLVFEHVLQVQGPTRPATMELVVTPSDPRKGEVTLEVTSVAEGWTQRDNVWTFSVTEPVVFPDRPMRSLPGEGDGPAPETVFSGLAAMRRFAEPCQPVELAEAAPANFGTWDSRSDRVVARGVEPVTIPKGAHVSRCDGVSLDTLMIAIARPADEAKLGAGVAWFLVPRDTPMRPADPKGDTRYIATQPLGGYHVCRQPAWTTATLEDINASQGWQLDDQGQWKEFVQLDSASKIIPAGSPVELLDTRDGWAVIEGTFGGRVLTLAVRASAVALPSGGGHAVLAFGGGLCPVARGQWRSLKSNAQAFRVSQDTPGAELAGLWLELPLGTQVLQLCQDGAGGDGKSAPREPGCNPIYVGGAQSKETDRFVLVRYAATYLALRESDLRERTTGEFAMRAERSWFWQAGKVKVEDEPSGWIFGLGPGARLGFVDRDDHAWVLKARMQKLTDDTLGFEGGFGVGGDGLGTFIELTAGLGKLLYRFSDGPFELRGAALGKLDFYTSGDQGLGFDLIGKAQLRWVNATAPVSLEVGVNLGYGGTFGAGGDGHFRFGMPLSLIIELATF